MSKNSCNHKSFWEIYKAINFNRKFCEEKGREFTCQKCGADCTLKWEGNNGFKKSLVKRLLTYFLWLLPALILIFLVASSILNFLIAILSIIIFHFGAMYYIIYSDRLIISSQ